MKKFKEILILMCFSHIISLYTPFNITQFQEMNRLSDPVLSPDGLYIIYSVKKWNSKTDKSYTNLQYTTIQTKETKDLTPKIEGTFDSSPLFSSLFPNYVFFIRENQIRYIKFPPTETYNPSEDYSIQLTNYPISINDYKIKYNTIVFSADVYFSCQNNLTCSSELIKKEEKMTYQTYDSLYSFYWDRWLVEGKGSHLFYQKIKLKDNKIELDGNVDDLTKGMEINTPPLTESNSNYDISNDGTMITFSAHHREHTEAWNTGWKTYFIDLNLMKKPILISGHNIARNPMSSIFY